MTYAITAAVCLALLAVMPFWGAGPESKAGYPLGAILLLAVLAVVAPLIGRAIGGGGPNKE